MNKLLSPREFEIARNVAWAEKEGLHSTAIEFARKYVNLDQQWLRLISDYYEADDYVEGPARDQAKNEAFAAVIAYARTFTRHSGE